MLDDRMHRDPFTESELLPGAPINWWEHQRKGWGAFRPVIAVIVCVRRGRIGIAALRKDGTWVPRWTMIKNIEKRIKTAR